MKSLISLVGIVLIIIGVLALGYEGFSYTQRENVAQIGDLKITADTQKTIYLPPALGGAALVAGIILVVVGRRNG